MLWIHPVLQCIGLLLSFYVLYLGYARFLVLHRGMKGVFAWKRHVALGLTVMAIWPAGFALGGGMAWWRWHIVMITGWHYQVALIMVPLLIFGLASGYVMDKHKKKRNALPLAHAINNAVLVLLAVCQLISGIGVIRSLVLP
jgi:hypothetical protein